ncbi:MAG TPA: nuclear transport factor 2 family protein [Trebonia sp.]
MREYEEAIYEKATREKALRPEDLTRLFVERANAKDADGIAALYEEHAVMAYPPGQQTAGREAIRAFWKQALPGLPRFEPEPPLPTLVSGDIALTSTPPRDGAGARAQVARRQPDGSWLRLLDQPEFSSVPAGGSPVGERRPAAS